MANPIQPGGQVQNGQVNASEDEQKAYDQFVKTGMRLLHGKDTAEVFEKRLGKSPPAQALADVTMALVRNIEEGMGQVPPAVALHGGIALFQQVVEVFESMTGKPVTDDVKKDAMQIASQQYFSEGLKSGKIQPEQLAEFQGALPQ